MKFSLDAAQLSATENVMMKQNSDAEKNKTFVPFKNLKIKTLQFLRYFSKRV